MHATDLRVFRHDHSSDVIVVLDVAGGDDSNKIDGPGDIIDLLDMILLIRPKTKLRKRVVIVPVNFHAGNEHHRRAGRLAVDDGYFRLDNPLLPQTAVESAVSVLKNKGSTIQIGVYANAFEGEQGESAANKGLHATRSDLNDDTYSRFACSWVDAGATIVGGCCGIDAGHIHQLTGSFLKKSKL